MELFDLYRRIGTILDQVDFDRLFPGFHRYSWALYSNSEICLNGEILPYDPSFMGNTSLLYQGEYIAIWNVGADPIEDEEVLASSLVHEMFHCHQNTLGETRFPSDLTLLNYPADPENYVRKYRENCCLADAYERTDVQALARFAAIRALRYAAYPAMVREEWKAETLEGMAEYIGLKALEQINGKKFRVKVEQFLRLIREEGSLQFDIRRISYYTGAIFALCLERLGYEVRNAFGSEQTVYEQNPISAAKEVQITPCPSLHAAYTQMMEERRQTIEEHISTASYTECCGQICGYDPMNMFRVGNMIFCRTMIFLKINGQVQSFLRKIVVVLQDGSDRVVTGYY